MPSQYFALTDDVYFSGRWDLGRPIDTRGQKVDDWLFTKGAPVSLQEHLRVPIRGGDGQALDYSEVGIGVPLVSARAAAVFTQLAPADVQLIAVDVEAHNEKFYILVCTRLVKCIDDKASEEVRYWKPEHGQPARVGEYRSVSGMRIDPSKVGDIKVLRPWGWDGALIVSEDIKQELERVGTLGARFKDVTGPSTLSAEEREEDRKRRELYEIAAASRDAVWRTLGRLDDQVFMPIAMSDSWPGHRKLWRVVRRDAGRSLVVTHGLSDPFIERLQPSVGVGLELVLEVDATVKDLSKGWPLVLLERVADEVVAHESVREGVLAGLFSMEVSGKGLPKSFVTEHGRAGVLLGTESRTLPRHFPTPFGEVRLITVKALMPSELVYLLTHGTGGRVELARRFVEGGEGHVSSLRRKPMV